MKNKILGLSMIFCMVLVLVVKAEEVAVQATATANVDTNGYTTLTTPPTKDKKPLPAEMLQKWQKRGEELNNRLNERSQDLLKKVDDKAALMKDKLGEQRAKALEKGNDKRVGKIDEKMKRVDEKAADKKAKINEKTAERKKKLQEVQDKIEAKIAEKDVKFEIGSEVKFAGIVVENKILEATDALNSLTVKTMSGTMVNVAYTGGLLGCVNSKLNATASVIKAGQKVEVFAKVTSENNLSTCGSENYFIKVVNSGTNPAPRGLGLKLREFLFGWFGRK